MNTDRLQLGLGFTVRWVVASAIGLMAGFFVYFMSVVGLTAEHDFLLRTLVSAGSGAILGAAVGGAQLFVLRREILGMNRWMVANLVGGVVGGVVALPVAIAVGDAAGFHMAVFAGIIVLGLSIGIAQVVILREHLLGSGWWILAHTAGMPLGWALGRGLGETLYTLMVGGMGESTAQIIATLITVILFFGGYGMITGGVLVRLLNGNPINERN
jgi:hypothetical protein